jgi:hypothetical protein
VHGLIDYFFGLGLILIPYLLGFSGGGAAQWVIWIFGFAIIGMSLLTKFEAGLIRVVPVPVHLAIDGLAGLIVAASPWIFGFAEQVWVPHVVLGLLEVGLALVTRTAPARMPSQS